MNVWFFVRILIIFFFLILFNLAFILIDIDFDLFWLKVKWTIFSKSLRLLFSRLGFGGLCCIGVICALLDLENVSNFMGENLEKEGKFTYASPLALGIGFFELTSIPFHCIFRTKKTTIGSNSLSVVNRSSHTFCLSRGLGDVYKRQVLIWVTKVFECLILWSEFRSFSSLFYSAWHFYWLTLISIFFGWKSNGPFSASLSACSLVGSGSGVSVV